MMAVNGTTSPRLAAVVTLYKTQTINADATGYGAAMTALYVQLLVAVPRQARSWPVMVYPRMQGFR